MFNPVLNADGSVSYFRIICLVVATACFVSGCVMDDSSSQTVAPDENVTAVQEESVKETTKEETDFGKLRSYAISEIISDSLYMQTCGALDRGYENCSVTLSDNLKPYYDLSLDAADDGFAIMLRAKDSNKDECRVFEADSNGVLKATDSNGLDDQNCTAMLDMSSRKFSILRDTDANEGQMAPSGLRPIVKNLTQR
ncbi:MAG: hypothetical protein ACI4UM_05660 [Succinivibrio sp.]